VTSLKTEGKSRVKCSKCGTETAGEFKFCPSCGEKLKEECEICGAEGAGYIILVEGAKLHVCEECSGAGKILRAPAPPPASKKSPPESIKAEMEVVEGYGKLIAEARKRLGLPVEVLAERINEKVSFLERIEHEKTLPDERVARKLEKELGIRLLQPAAIGGSAAGGSSQGGVTLGDIIEIERKERKKG
ncbi:MAG: multiprotein bridging factor aMBF1, partial [Candidatus Micrarchaeota archaeon]|nr:multiprotein bridging factor aMBF1 [Candidatus Micrarchaeota archaeon]